MMWSARALLNTPDLMHLRTATRPHSEMVTACMARRGAGLRSWSTAGPRHAAFSDRARYLRSQSQRPVAPVQAQGGSILREASSDVLLAERRDPLAHRRASRRDWAGRSGWLAPRTRRWRREEAPEAGRRLVRGFMSASLTASGGGWPEAKANSSPGPPPRGPPKPPEPPRRS